MRPAPQLLLLLLCHAGLFVSVTPQNVCQRPPPQDGSELTGGQVFFEPGTEVMLSCSQGYTPTGGSRSIVCKSSGEWTERTLKCSRKRCPVPDQPQNGRVDFTDIVYESTLTYSCDEGYVLHGDVSSECLHTARWSNPFPECKPVTCDLPDVPPYAKIVYDRPVKGNITEFGFGGTYECRPPMVLFGNARATCGADGFWTRPPQCRLVMCPVPTSIDNGFLSFAEQREYGYKERVKYGCVDPFVLDGPKESECEETGQWSRKPVCRAPCSVDIKRGRILYNGKKIWIEDFEPNQVPHSQQVAVYCLDEARKCGYPVKAYCVDGLLEIPACFEEPNDLKYKLSSSLPSEITVCS
ncbi:beta-2-glycoprotein 1-like [Salminus brasiliensis]|uniref:beta-2-glycoprotein 1-like n=1 Tax=Salminus brasiliensis TaxID=930266 RepID=UPI003B839120